MTLLWLYQMMLLVVIGVLLPVMAVRNSADTRHILQQRPGLRATFYQQGAIMQWFLVALILVAQWWQGGGLSAIGWSTALSWHFWLSMSGLVMVSILTWKLYCPGPMVGAWLVRLYSHVAHYLPVDTRSYSWGVVMAVTAGICEELIYRGLLYHLLIQWIPDWSGMILANVVFAVTHYSTGWVNAAGAFVLGLLFSWLYWLTGDLWLSMWLHAAIDLLAVTLYPLAVRNKPS
ncbi:CPBP family intramembrane glutamic endopeptidase [Marinicella sediminis]|uniref:CPBP family intramembrane glutamic endopeptidase n=1 Tax=Marinicella sediminis TaxID=1792834 RepID=A0ABV7JBA9_9GAMM|nr:type II CAAX endopeptidase family protein [Marinicella sediminis]